MATTVYSSHPDRDPNPAIAKATGGGKLTVGQYEAFVARLPGPIIGHQTTPTEAAYLLGIQFVLGELKRALVK